MVAQFNDWAQPRDRTKMDALSQFTAVHKEIVNVEFENCSSLCQKFPNPPGNLCKISSEDVSPYIVLYLS